MENEIFIQDEWQVMQKAVLSKNFGATCLGLVFKWENGSVGPTEHSHKTCHSGMWYNMGNRGFKKKITSELTPLFDITWALPA